MAMEKMDETIKLMEDELIEVKKIQSFLDKSSTHYYYNHMQLAEGLMKSMKWHENVDEYVKGLENMLSFYKDLKTRLVNLGLNDVNDKIFLIDNLYLSINCDDNQFYMYFYFDKDGELYDNFYDSHSGLNEWICNRVEGVIKEFAWVSDYSIPDFSMSQFDKNLTYTYQEKVYPFEYDHKLLDNIVTLIKVVRGDSGYEKAHKYVAGQIENKMNSIYKLMEEYKDS